MCVAAREDGKVVVTGLWVDHSYDIGMPVDASSVRFCIHCFILVSLILSQLVERYKLFTLID